VKALLALSGGDGKPDTGLLLSLVLLEVSPHISARAMASLYGDRHGLEKELVPDAHALAAVLDACGRSGGGASRHAGPAPRRVGRGGLGGDPSMADPGR